jgi:hypothetical protein
MRREIIQDFLNVPGIVGIALMDGLSSPYFRGFELRHQGVFEPDQQITVAQSIQQVLETTPEGFNAFEFQFDFHRVYLHKLNQGITLLVLTGNQVSGQNYTQAVRRLLIELQIDQADPVAEFRALALDIPLPPALPLVPIESLLSQSLSVEPLTFQIPSPASQQPASQQPLKPPQQVAIQPEEAIELAQQPPELPPELPPSQTHLMPAPQAPESHSAVHVDLKDVLSAINRLSQLTTQYLGTMVVSNYWKATRPPVDWLNHFQVERSAQMTFSVQMPSERLPILTAEQYQCLQAWVAAFIERCSKVIREFTKLVHQTLTQQQIALLFSCNLT